MEWNAKLPSQWDWEDLIMVNSTAENPKRLQATDWGTDGEREIDTGSFYSSKGRSGSGGSGSDLGHTSLSKSSKSASINSSSIGEVKTSKLNLKASETVADLNNNEELVKSRPTGCSPTLEASIGSGEPLLGLKLGKRTYFEDVCAGSNPKTSAFSMVPASSVTLAKRSKSSSQALNIPRCQVEGCNLDLSMAKDYHRKHRVCESHSKCPKVVVAGVERRFCQQCSRFHGLSEFDEKKRSCRRRLSDHNARRRKPQQEATATLSSSLYDERRQMNFVWNRAPNVHSGPNANFIWESTSSSKFTITKEQAKPAKIEVVDGQLHLHGNQISNSIPMHHCNSNVFLPSKGKNTTSGAINQALEEQIISSNVDTTQDLHRALSLLSTNTWDLSEPKSVCLENTIDKNHTSMPQSAMPLGFPLASSEYWRTEQQSTDSQIHNMTSNSDGSSYLQEFQLLRVPYEGDFYSDQMN